MKVIEAKTEQQIKTALSIRDQVFIDEQGVSPEIEHDHYDQTALHIVGYLDQKAIAVARVRFIDQNKGKIQRVAILKPYRGQGYGKQLMLAIESIIGSHQGVVATLHAQTQAQAFYQSLGYEAVSEPFYEANIEHIKMEKLLK